MLFSLFLEGKVPVMKRLFSYVVLIASFFPLSSALADGGGLGLKVRIATIGDFREHVADRQAVDNRGNWTISRGNGQLAGQINGAKLTGRWNWQDKYYCREGSAGGQEISDCWRVELQSDTLRLRPSIGYGTSLTYRLK